MNLLRTVIIISLATLLFVACAGKTKVESNLRIKGAPDWVNKGTNILNDKKGRLFHGVGSAPDINNEALQRTTADNRARAEIARIFTSYMDIVARDYTGATGSGSDLQTEQDLSQQIENITKVNLTGAKIIGRWRNKKNNTVYSIAELDMKRVKNSVKNISQMNPGFLEFFEKEADNIFDKEERK